MRDGGATRVGTGYVVAALSLAVVAQVVAFEAVRRVFVGSVRGQWLDAAALSGHYIGAGYTGELVDTVLNAMTVLSLAAATVAVGFIALARGRFALAGVATLLILGSNLTTQVLKFGIDRPEFGVDAAREAAGNSLPSGHTTVAASVAIALVLVLPAAVRGVAGLVGAGYAALAGVATVAAAWHRPSDAVAALLVVGVWAAGAGMLLAPVHSSDSPGSRRRSHRPATLTLIVAGVLLLALAAGSMAFTYEAMSTPVELLSQARLLVAYAGGAAGIAGTAALVMALVLAAVHRVVPERRPDRDS